MKITKGKKIALIVFIIVCILIGTAFAFFNFNISITKKNNKARQIERLWEERCEHLGIWILAGEGGYKVGSDYEINRRFEEAFGVLELSFMESLQHKTGRYNRSDVIEWILETEQKKKDDPTLNKLKKIVIEYHVKLEE